MDKTILRQRGGGAAVGEALVEPKGVRMITFTGSTAVGRRVGKLAGKDLRRVALLPNTRAQGSARTRFSITPRRSISTRTISPTRRNFPSAMPTPAGVPVEITSPGSSVMTVER